jgi:HD-like signal output (HDOD) protein/FixJ family two-component response regulator
MKILVVDDDPVTRALLKKMLSDFAECEAAENGTDAITAFKKERENGRPFDIITLDISMPDMDGKEVLQKIRAIEGETDVPKGTRVKILMASSNVDKNTILTCVQMGCDNYIAKPFDKKVIIQKIEKLGFSVAKSENKLTDVQSLEEIEAGQEDKASLKTTLLRIVQKFQEGKIELPVLPSIFNELQEVMKEPNSTVNDLTRIIEKDSVISIRIIAGANSPFYRGTEKITSVEKAIPRLGFRETVSIVSAISNKSLYLTDNKDLKKLMEKLWLHSLASAYGAKIIAIKLGLGHEERYFLMGLIHDIGKVLLLKALGDVYAHDISSNMSAVFTIIQKVHAKFGGAIIKRWGLTERFIRIALQHEGPDFNTKTDKEVLLINLASNLANHLGYSLLDHDVDLLQLDATKHLGIDPNSFDMIGQEVKEMVLGASDFL